jgi:hypothetical protein
MCRRQLQLAAKPSEIFVNKDRHDGVFSQDVPERPRDIIWACNAYKAVKRGLQKYLRLPVNDNDQTHAIFVKPIVKQSMHFIAMMDLYQRRQDISAQYIYGLNKKAAGGLVEESEKFFKFVVKKTKEFYLSESKNLETEVSGKKMDAFLTSLCVQLGLDSDGAMPFTANAYEWQAPV